MTSMWKREAQRLHQSAAMTVPCPPVDRHNPVQLWLETLLSCADSPP